MCRTLVEYADKIEEDAATLTGLRMVLAAKRDAYSMEVSCAVNRTNPVDL